MHFPTHSPFFIPIYILYTAHRVSGISGDGNVWLLSISIIEIPPLSNCCLFVWFYNVMKPIIVLLHPHPCIFIHIWMLAHFNPFFKLHITSWCADPLSCSFKRERIKFFFLYLPFIRNCNSLSRSFLGWVLMCISGLQTHCTAKTHIPFGH
jgi:hypothetical protein